LIRSDRTHLSGAGKYATEILFRPMSPGPCLQFKKANDGVLYQCSLRELAIFSDDPKYRKTAVEIVDGSSFSMQHVASLGLSSAQLMQMRFSRILRLTVS
jgi:hypothetical protein